VQYRLPIRLILLLLPIVKPHRFHVVKTPSYVLLYVCTFGKEGAGKDTMWYQADNEKPPETTEVSDATAYYMPGYRSAPLCGTIPFALLQASIGVLRDRTAGAAGVRGQAHAE
jgi:hypothetical protein